jgi:hypothetical protein
MGKEKGKRGKRERKSTKTRATRRTRSIRIMWIRVRVVRIVQAETCVGVLICLHEVGCCAVAVACHLESLE